MKILQSIAVLLLLYSVYALFISFSTNCTADSSSLRDGYYSACISNLAETRVEGIAYLIMSIFVLVGTYIQKRGFFAPEALISTTQVDDYTPKSAEGNITPNTASNDISDELRKAKTMLDEGLIEEDEYKTLKAKIIDKS